MSQIPPSPDMPSGTPAGAAGTAMPPGAEACLPAHTGAGHTHAATAPHTRPRGIRNNNPGNLDYAGQPGAVLESVPAGEVARFARFPTPEAGLAALRDQLCRYITQDGIDTVATIIARWAPPSENNTVSYVCGVAQALNVAPCAPLGTPTAALLTGLMNAVIHVENGQNPYGALVNRIAAERPHEGHGTGT